MLSDAAFCQNTKSISKLFLLEVSLCMLYITHDGLLIWDTNRSMIISKDSYKTSLDIYTKILGYDIPKTVSCGIIDSDIGFLETQFNGVKTRSNILFQVTGDLTNIWHRGDDLFWSTSDGTLFKNDQIIEQFEVDASIFVLANGEIIKNDAFILSIDIINSTGRYCYITSKGCLRWSDKEQVFHIPNFKHSSLVNYLLYSIQLTKELDLTVMIIDHEINVFENTKQTKKLNFSDSMSTLTDLALYCKNDTKHLLLVDIDGLLSVIELGHDKMVFKSRLGSKIMHFTQIPDSSSFIVYSDEDAFLLTYKFAGRYRLSYFDMPFLIKRTVAKDNKNFNLCTKDNKIYNISFENEPVIIKKIDYTDKMTINKLIMLPCSNRFIIASCFRSTTNHMEVDSNEYISDLYIFDIKTPLSGWYLNIPEKYRDATVTDIMPIPFVNPEAKGETSVGETFYAKRAAFDRCFMVSLDYHSSDEEQSPNLLLYTIDEDTGKVDYQTGISTSYSITKMHNYYNQTILVAGGFLQALKVDYSVKENAFTIDPVSSSFELRGYVTNLITFPYECPEPESTIMKEDRILLSNILKGIQEFKLFRTLKTGRIRIEPTLFSESHPLTKEFSGVKLILDIERVQLPNITCFAVCMNGSKILLYYSIHNAEYRSIEFGLDSPVISLTPATTPSSSLPPVAITDAEPIQPLFFVNTQNGGLYVIRTIQDERQLEDAKFHLNSKMIEQYKYLGIITEMEDNLDVPFFDERILKVTP